jgi:hypothetical protein
MPGEVDFWRSEGKLAKAEVDGDGNSRTTNTHFKLHAAWSGLDQPWPHTTGNHQGDLDTRGVHAGLGHEQGVGPTKNHVRRHVWVPGLHILQQGVKPQPHSTD